MRQSLLLYHSDSYYAVRRAYLFRVGVGRIADKIADSFFCRAAKRHDISAERRDNALAHTLAVSVNDAHALFKLRGRDKGGEVDGILNLAALDVAYELP